MAEPVDWTQWQVAVCALIVAVPSAAAVAVIFRSDPDPIRSSDLWNPCWKRVHPLWLLAYRAIVCAVMSYHLIDRVAYRGASNFYVYTQWTFTLVIIYFLIATLISAHGCWTYSRRYVIENEEVARRLLERDFEANLPEELMSRTSENCNSVKLQNYHEQGENEQMAGFWGYTMQIVYQASGGAAILADLTFWFLLVPFADPEYLNMNPRKFRQHFGSTTRELDHNKKFLSHQGNKNLKRISQPKEASIVSMRCFFYLTLPSTDSNFHFSGWHILFCGPPRI